VIFVLVVTFTGTRFVNYLKIEKENSYKIAETDVTVDQAQGVVLKEYLSKLDHDIIISDNVDISADNRAITSSTRYVVVNGDNLWNISKKYYGSGALWHMLVNIDPGKLENPDFILPGYIFLVQDVRGER
jgi:nucleoid-associated protein YgaU